MIRKYLIPLLAVAGIGLAVFVAITRGKTTPPPAQPLIAPAQSPYPDFIAGSGLVEASTENIAIATPVGGIVSQIYVQTGSRVKKDDLLFSIDSRATRAELAVQQAAVQVAQAQFDNAKHQFARAQSITDPRAMSAEEREDRRDAVEIAEAQLAQARANVETTETNLELMTVRSPMDGEVLQLNVHLGEYAPANQVSPPAILFGDTEMLHIRVDVDEEDAWRVKVGAPAMGFLEGNRDVKTALQFVRIEPYVVPKISLTGSPTEQVDTRVLQVIYSFTPGDLPFHVGEMMDVFIKAEPESAALPKP